MLFGCASTKISIENAAERAALLAARPILEKIFYAEAPIAPSNRELYPTVPNLPGQAFEPQKYFNHRLRFSKSTVELLPGDYRIPVMSYCMKSSGSSPTAHLYQLGKLSGPRAVIIRDLNAKALLQFQAGKIQAASWTIQNGIPYEEMPADTRKIIDTVIPEHRKHLEKSFFIEFSEKWDAASEKLGLPWFDEITDEALKSLGDFGETIRSLREFRRLLRESSGSYDNLKSLISLPGVSESPGTEMTTPWSRLSENVYARFLTSGHFLEVGQLQIRVLATKRGPQSSGSHSTKIDIADLVADPRSGSIQPLSFSILQASAAIPLLAVADPKVVAAFLAALIVAEYTDWQAIGEAIEKWGATTQQEVKGLIDKLRQMYSKEFGDKPGQIKSPPAIPAAFPDLTPAKQKTSRPGGGLRARWKDADGNIYEWDYQHGKLEKYDRRGKHQGEYDPTTGQQTKPRDPKRKVEP